MSANTIDGTKYTDVANNTVFDAVLDATAILAWRENVRTVVDQHSNEINSKAEIAIESVTTPTLLNGWVNFGGVFATACYYKDNFGKVNLQGYIKSGTTAINTILFVLPIGYRPTASHGFTVYSNDGISIGAIQVQIDGNVRFISGSNASLSLSGCYFRTT